LEGLKVGMLKGKEERELNALRRRVRGRFVGEATGDENPSRLRVNIGNGSTLVTICQ
jgi:hypothetical protein